MIGKECLKLLINFVRELSLITCQLTPYSWIISSTRTFSSNIYGYSLGKTTMAGGACRTDDSGKMICRSALYFTNFTV